MRSVFLLALLLCALGARAQDADALIGLWSGGMTFPQPLQGKLVVAREGGVWRATIGGVQGETAGVKRFRIVFPGGELRGRLHGQQLEAFWLQPPGGTPEQRDPGGSGQPFASPLTLRRTDRNHWQGTVRPLAGRFTLYLKIFRNETNSLVGAFRNPEFNSNGGASRLAVVREGDAVTFRLPPPPAPADIHIEAKLLSPDRLQLVWPDLGQTIELTRRPPAEVAAFFPRPPGEPPYVYQQPPATGDGWTTARAKDAGLDEAALARLVQRLIDADPAARRPALIHSLLIARRGKLVLEEYFFGFDRDEPHDTRSAAKTFAALMMGGTSLTPDTPVFELMKAKGPFANPDPRKARITIGQLMTHTSGLDCDDNDEHSAGNEETMQRQTAQPDWWKHTLDLPVAHDPGTRYAYCSAGMNLVGGALTTATKTWLPELFDRTVARPLQFGPYYWNLMPTGEGYQGGGAFVRPRDLLKIGQTWLDGGVWRGRRIAGKSWAELSTTPHVHISPRTTGLDAEHFAESYNEADDGYAWHLYQLKSGDRTYREYEANGNGGQLMMVLPELQLVVVFTAGNYMQGGIWGRFRDQVLTGEIVPAVRR
ncbi:MAG TPA: serine hydrolase [Thermoanaerobaculia bacterium]|jgi:CubicO group peptidase (beta-lactamase class C family)|nr:serine hydrolase [Thermoanaerobaculia bacterium]